VNLEIAFIGILLGQKEIRDRLFLRNTVHLLVHRPFWSARGHGIGMPPGVIGHHIATLWIHPRIAGTEKLKGFYFCDLTVCTQASAQACAAECGNVSQTLGLGCGVGRGLGIGVPLGVGVGRGVAVGVAVVVAVGVGVGVPPSVTVRVTGTATKGRTGSLLPMQTLAWCVPTVRSLASMCTVTCLQGLFRRGRLTLGN
jgi:hypothetical protein